MKFKVGDRVKVVKETLLWTSEDIGKTGRIIDFSGWNYKTDIGSGYWHRPDGLKLLGRSLMCELKDAKFGIQYERDEDPVEYFKTKKDAEKRIEELLEDTEVDKTKIYLFSVSDVYQVKRPTEYSLVKV